MKEYLPQILDLVFALAGLVVAYYSRKFVNEKVANTNLKSYIFKAFDILGAIVKSNFANARKTIEKDLEDGVITKEEATKMFKQIGENTLKDLKNKLGEEVWDVLNKHYGNAEEFFANTRDGLVEDLKKPSSPASPVGK